MRDLRDLFRLTNLVDACEVICWVPVMGHVADGTCDRSSVFSEVNHEINASS